MNPGSPDAMCRPCPDEQQVPTPLDAEPKAPALPPSCDSSDCSYCQGVARLRRDAGGNRGCWLRRKRSRTDLAGLVSGAGADADVQQQQQLLDAGDTAVVPDVGGLAKQARVSMWAHALAEQPSLVEAALAAEPEAEDSGGSSTWDQTSSESAGGYWSSGSGSDVLGHSAGFRPWAWQAAWAERPEPPPARLRQVAAFQRPQAAGCQRQTADIVCAVEFEEHGWLVATAGVAKQVRVYSLSSYLEHPGSRRWQQPIRVHRMPSKLSSLAWNPDQPGVVTVGDYDGEVSQIDLESGHLVAEADGHAGRRVWSVSHSPLRPHLCASASDDGTARLWAGPGLAAAAGTVAPPGGAPVCGVQLSPFDEHALAVASSDHCVYLYDLRRTLSPLCVLRGHDRAASYARFLGRASLASASVDASLAVWHLPGKQPDLAPAACGAAGAAEGPAPLLAACQSGCSGCGRHAGEAWDTCAGAPVVRPWRRFRGHRNSKNFVGLAVRPEGQLLACGSEGPGAETCCYQVSWAAPLARCSLGSSSGGEAGRAAFCSAVCWQPATACGAHATPLLAAAMSDGELRVLGLQAEATQG